MKEAQKVSAVQSLHKRFVLEPKAAQALTKGLLAPDEFSQVYGIAALARVDPTISDYYVNTIIDKGPSDQSAKWFMNELINLSADPHREHPSYSRIVEWIPRIYNEILKDEKNEYQLKNDSLRYFFSQFPYASASGYLNSIVEVYELGGGVRRTGERLSRIMIGWDTVRYNVGREKDTFLVEDHMRHWYMSTYKEIDPVVEGALLSLKAFSPGDPHREYGAGYQFHVGVLSNKEIHSLTCVEREVNPVGSHVYGVSESNSFPTVPVFPGELSWQGQKLIGTLVTSVERNGLVDDAWVSHFIIKGASNIIELAKGPAVQTELDAIQEALDKGFTPFRL